MQEKNINNYEKRDGRKFLYLKFNSRDITLVILLIFVSIFCVLNFNYYSATKDEVGKLEKNEASSEYAESKMYGF